jgi:hypothetical protein
VETNVLQRIKSPVESSYPTPLAAAFRRCRTADRADLASRHRFLVDLFEAFVKFLAVVELQEARAFVPDLREKLFPGEEPFVFLRRPSLGEWVGLLRELSNLRSFCAEPVWLKDGTSWYLQGRNARNGAALERLAEIDGLEVRRGSSTPHAEICNSLVTYRNRKFGHGPHPPEEELRVHIPVLEEALACLLEPCDFLARMNVFHVERVEVGQQGLWHIHGTRLSGVAEEHAEYLSHHQLQLSEIYAYAGEGEILAPPVPLGPFLLWRENESLKRYEVFFYDRAMRTRLQYISYGSGAAHFHTSSGGFRDLVSLDLRPGLGEKVDPHLPDDEKAERAERLYKTAMALMEEKKYEDSIEALEVSVEYDRRPETLLAMARVQSLLGESKETVSGTLCSCLELEPENSEARARLAGCEAPAEEKAKDNLEGDDGSLTTLHALVPARLREYTILCWLGLVAAWYTFSAAWEYLAGHWENLFPLALLLLCCVLWIVQIVFGHSILLSIEKPLSLQLHAMRLDRFRSWFKDQMRLVFGKYALADGTIDLAATVRGERWYYLLFPLWALGLGLSAFFLSRAHSMPLPLALKRLVDYSLVFALGWPVFRFAIGSTLFILRYSRLSLRPVLTRLNEWGVRSFTPLIAFNSTMTALIYILYWVMAFHSIDPGLTFKADIIFLGITTILYAIWTVLMPASIRVAVKQAKGSAVNTYADHIERAFRDFIERPGEETLGRYRWLMKNQRLIRKIGTWPLSLLETFVYVIGSNLVLLLMDFWYVSARLGTWPHIVQYVRTLLRI